MRDRAQAVLGLALAVTLVGSGIGIPIGADSANPSPDSSFYPLEQAGESIKKPFVKPMKGNVDYNLDMAKERMNEFENMVDENKTQEHLRLLERSENHYVKAFQKAKTEREQKRAREQYRKHIRVLENVKQKVPEQAKQGIETAQSRSRKGLEMLDKKPESILNDLPSKNLEGGA